MMKNTITNIMASIKTGQQAGLIIEGETVIKCPQSTVQSPSQSPSQTTGQVCIHCGGSNLQQNGPCFLCLECGSTTGCG